MQIEKDEYSYIYELVKDKQYDKAISILVDLNTNQLRKRFRADVNHSWYCVGKIFSNKQNYSDAVKAFKKSLKTRVDDVQALWLIADSYSELKKPKLAERYYRKAIMYAQNHKDIMAITYNLGNALFDQKRFDEAIACYEKIDESIPDTYKLAQSNIKLFAPK
jgi:tetratricopeptide (TPR) repeat protein